MLKPKLSIVQVLVLLPVPHCSLWAALPSDWLIERGLAQATCHPPGGCPWQLTMLGNVPHAVYWAQERNSVPWQICKRLSRQPTRAYGLSKSFLFLCTCSLPLSLLAPASPLSPSCSPTLPKPINICCLGQKYCAVTLLSQPLLKKNLVN